MNVTYTHVKSVFNRLQLRRWQKGSLFIRLAVVGSQICEIPEIPGEFELIAVQG